MNDWIARFEPNADPIIMETGNCRFDHDHLHVDNEQCSVIIDALILNQKALFEQHHTNDFLQLVLSMRHDKPKDYFNDFRGPFTGLFYDKRTRQAEVFTNQTGDSAVFYYLSDQVQVFSSNFSLLVDYLKENHQSLHFDEKAAHWMLTFGYLIDDATYIQEIKQLTAGKVLFLNDGGWLVERYHRFLSDPITITEDEALERMDTLFRQAVRRCFDKDLEYGHHEHLADMSAGMDSRMVNCVAKALGYGRITNLSYSQTGTEEDRLSKQASAWFGNAMMFEPLDDHAFVFDLEALVRSGYGIYLYSGITGGARLLSKIDFSRFGVEHTGLLGDVVVGGTYMRGSETEINVDALRLSHLLPLRYDFNPERFESQELYGLYTRGFKGIMASWFIRKKFTFALSPFLDVDFLSFCFSLPSVMRRDHQLYWRWVERFYPEALAVPTSRKRVPHTLPQQGFDFSNRAFHKALKVGRKLMFRLGLTDSRVRSDSSMNPYEYWYDTDPKMREFFDNYYRDHICLLNEHSLIKQEVDCLYNKGSVWDRLMALTVLGAYSYFVPGKAAINFLV